MTNFKPVPPEVERAVVNTWRSAASLVEMESLTATGPARAQLFGLAELFRRIADRKE